ncbi:MAG TPA: polyprenyl synthetase family protein [Actinomycetes bacterium]|nr:polyprenyl synthetase family protein [Actinomycetes bacterium]
MTTRTSIPPMPEITTRTGAVLSERRSPLDAEDLRARVQKVLDEFLTRQVAVLDDVSGDVGPLVETLTDLLAGGKRLRPAFCYWGWRGAGAADDAAIVTAATALELLQACALIHDDVMDGSDTRRGLPSAHRRFATLHQLGGWRGSAERFGTGAAILLGDLCLSWTDELLYGSGLPAAALARGKPILDRMRTELMAGQYLDLLEQSIASDSVERALRVIRFKSAKYTIEAPLHLGARLAGAGPDLLACYSAFGLPLGEAFQLRDDLLGVFGDPSETGKPAGDDLREGKRTVLIAIAVGRATRAQADVIQSHLGDDDLDTDGVALLRSVLEETGARDEVESLIATNAAQAVAALDTTMIDEPAREVLRALAHAATSRSV